MYFLPEGTSTTLNPGKSLGASSADTEGSTIHSLPLCMYDIVCVGGVGRGDSTQKLMKKCGHNGNSRCYFLILCTQGTILSLPTLSNLVVNLIKFLYEIHAF